MDVADRIRGYIKEEVLIGPDQSIDVDTPLLKGLLDSADLLRLTTFIEESFQVSIESSDMSAENFGTIRDLERFVVSQLSRTWASRGRSGQEGE